MDSTTQGLGGVILNMHDSPPGGETPEEYAARMAEKDREQSDKLFRKEVMTVGFSSKAIKRAPLSDKNGALKLAMKPPAGFLSKGGSVSVEELVRRRVEMQGLSLTEAMITILHKTGQIDIIELKKKASAAVSPEDYRRSYPTACNAFNRLVELEIIVDDGKLCELSSDCLPDPLAYYKQKVKSQRDASYAASIAARRASRASGSEVPAKKTQKKVSSMDAIRDNNDAINKAVATMQAGLGEGIEERLESLRKQLSELEAKADKIRTTISMGETFLKSFQEVSEVSDE